MDTVLRTWVEMNEMIAPPPPIPVPLRADPDGTIRIGNTRVLLEIVIHAFQRGETIEGIVQSYPTLKLEDVYAVIAYYLQNQAEVDEYVRQAEAEGERIRREIEAQQPALAGLRERLLKRMEEKKRST
jgi:uncharacterized protein (DUF433 family)